MLYLKITQKNKIPLHQHEQKHAPNINIHKFGIQTHTQTRYSNTNYEIH